MKAFITCSAAALCVLAMLLACSTCPAAAQTPFCHRSGYSNITDCAAANAAKMALWARAAKEVNVTVVPSGSSCTECGPNTYTVVQEVPDKASWKVYDDWEHNQPEYNQQFVAGGTNKGLAACKADGACTAEAMAPKTTTPAG